MSCPIGPGTEEAHDVDKYSRHGDRVAVFAGLYVEIIAVLGLLFLLAHLRNQAVAAQAKRACWTPGLVAASFILTGFTVAASPTIAHAYGGSGGGDQHLRHLGRSGAPREAP